MSVSDVIRRQQSTGENAMSVSSRQHGHLADVSNIRQGRPIVKHLQRLFGARCVESAGCYSCTGSVASGTILDLSD